MEKSPSCPHCNSAYVYEDRGHYVCPECAHEWLAGEPPIDENSTETFKDANGNALSDGDTVALIKDLKVKASSSIIKIGTKVKNIRLVDSDHNIDCKISGIGAMKLKSEFVKKI